MARWVTDKHQDSQRFIEGLIAEAVSSEPQYRKIDYVEPRARNKPMRVLCLGFSRTGTYSLTVAFEMLGFKPYHHAQMMQNVDVDLPCWTEAIEQKYLGRGLYKPWGRDEFDKLTAMHDVVLDIPMIQFAEELIQAYPDAKVVLSHRPVDDWVKSIRKTLGFWYGRSIWLLFRGIDPHFFDHWARWQIVADDIFHFSETQAGSDAPRVRKVYQDHYEHIRKICPKDRLLEFPLGSGWDELCPFLGVDKPEAPYPNINNTDFVNYVHRSFVTQMLWKGASKLMVVSVPVACSLWYFREPLKAFTRRAIR